MATEVDDKPAQAPVKNATSFECGICLLQEPIETAVVTVSCKHQFCPECISVLVDIARETDVVTPQCGHQGCDVRLSEEDIKSLLTAQGFEDFRRECQRVAAQGGPRVFKCREWICGGAARVPPGDSRFVCPKCSASRCIQCDFTGSYHEGLSCDEAANRPGSV